MEEQEATQITVRVPSRILHFSDGTLEIFDDEEEKKPETQPEEPPINEVSHVLR